MVRSLAVLCLIAATAVAVAGPGKKEADRAIADLRNAKDAKTKATALLDIGKIGQVQKSLVASAVDDVAAALKDKEAAVRAAAAECYGQLDPDPKEAVPALVKLLTADDEDVRVRAGAARGLGAIGAGAKDAVPELRKVQQAYRMKTQGKMPTDKASREALALDRELFQATQAAVLSIQPRKK